MTTPTSSCRCACEHVPNRTAYFPTVVHQRRRRLRRRKHQGPRRPRCRTQAPGDVYRLHWSRWSTSPRLRNRRQLDRRSARRLLHRGELHHPSRSLGHGDRQWPRHPCRHARERPVGGRGGAHRAARRRQVRQHAATKSRAVCMASACRSSTRSPSVSNSRSGATVRSISRATSAVSR